MKYLILFLLALPSHSWGQVNQYSDTLKTAFTLEKDLVWVSPKGFDLTMDIFTPNSNRIDYPVIVIFHGGAWLVNDNRIMHEAAEYLSTHGEYVVCNVNYRLLSDLNNTVTFNEMVEDVFGAILWVKENIKKYKGNPEKIVVTGDSSGGYLATLIVTQGDNLSSNGLSKGILSYNPTWKPKGKTAEDIAKENGMDVQAAIISYGSFDLYEDARNGFEQPKNVVWSMANAEPRGVFGEDFNINDHPELYKMASPMHNTPNVKDKKLPPILFTVGSKDKITTPASIEAYITKMKDSGHTNIEYWIHENRPHRFLESGSNESFKINFDDDAVPALNKMLAYLNDIFYK